LRHGFGQGRVDGLLDGGQRVTWGRAAVQRAHRVVGLGGLAALGGARGFRGLVGGLRLRLMLGLVVLLSLV